MPEVGNLEQITEHVVAVEAHEWIDVEQHGNHAGEEDHVVGQVVNLPWFGHRPEQDGQSGDYALHVHAGQADDESVAFPGKSPAGGGVDVRAGCENDQISTHFRYVSAEMLAGIGVAEFMDQFQPDQRDPHHGQVLRQ